MSSGKIIIIGLGLFYPFDMTLLKRIEEHAEIAATAERHGIEIDTSMLIGIPEDMEETMRKQTLAMAIVGALSSAACSSMCIVRRMQDEEIFRISIVARDTTGNKAYSSAHVRQYRHHHRKQSVLVAGMLHMKRKLPRGIHRDNHGRPETKKLTPARASRRNGSRN